MPEINAFDSAQQSIEAGRQRLNNAARDIALQRRGAVRPMVDLIVADHQTKIGVKVARAANEMQGTLLDLMR